MRKPDRSGKILIREDELAVRGQLQMFLAGQGYSVELARDNDDLLTRLDQAEAPPSLVMLGAGISSEGLDTVRAIRRTFPDLPVIVISSMCSPRHVAEAMT